MKSNVGGIDKILRSIMGLFLLSLIFWGPKTYWGLVGIIPLLTAIVGFCPVYLPFKISTKKSDS